MHSVLRRQPDASSGCCLVLFWCSRLACPSSRSSKRSFPRCLFSEDVELWHPRWVPDGVDGSGCTFYHLFLKTADCFSGDWNSSLTLRFDFSLTGGWTTGRGSTARQTFILLWCMNLISCLISAYYYLMQVLQIWCPHLKKKPKNNKNAASALVSPFTLFKRNNPFSLNIFPSVFAASTVSVLDSNVCKWNGLGGESNYSHETGAFAASVVGSLGRWWGAHLVIFGIVYSESQNSLV